MNRVVGILAASAVVSGCATSQQQIDSHAPALNSWVGAPIEEFLDMQGTPTTVIDKVNYQIYKFDARKTRRYVKWGKHCDQTTNPLQKHCEDVVLHTHITTFKCTYELVVVENVINDWSMNGNNCRMIAVSHRTSDQSTGGFQG